jgi:hypothetical protein
MAGLLNILDTTLVSCKFFKDACVEEICQFVPMSRKSVRNTSEMDIFIARNGAKKY